jgi:hypothetical protein
LLPCIPARKSRSQPRSDYDLPGANKATVHFVGACAAWAMYIQMVEGLKRQVARNGHAYGAREVLFCVTPSAVRPAAACGGRTCSPGAAMSYLLTELSIESLSANPCRCRALGPDNGQLSASSPGPHMCSTCCVCSACPGTRSNPCAAVTM